MRRSIAGCIALAMPLLVTLPNLASARGSEPIAGILEQSHVENASPKQYSVGGALDISGNVSFSISNVNRTVSASIEKIRNNSSTTTSGSIEVMLFVTAAPISGSFTYWVVGEQALDPLPPNYAYNNLAGTVPLKSVPDGVYYIHLGVFEYEGTCGSASGYCSDDIVSFDEQVQVSGGNYTAALPVTVTSVEYFHAGFGHYFVTGSPDEIAALDAGLFSGWTRTGQTFKVWTSDGLGRTGVCRFFTTAFAPRSSHFYTPHAPECATVQHNPIWQYEGVVAFVQLPTSSGACAGAVPLYRLYNNGMSGAPNHRYTTSMSVRSQMIAQGWVPEGSGSAGVIACLPN